MALTQRRPSHAPSRRRRGVRLHAVGTFEGGLHPVAGSPARAMQRELAHRWDRGLDDDAFGPRYSPAARVTLLLGSASLAWVGLVVAVRLALG